MAWIIDTDNGNEEFGSGIATAAGRSWGSEALVAELRANPKAGVRFRLKDDDGEVYFLGRYLSRRDPTAISESAFGPLMWAEGYAGCTSIEYLRGDVWEIL